MTSAASDAPLRHHGHADLPCHATAQAIFFYLRLLPCQPRATPTTEINGGLYGPPFIEVKADRGTFGRSQKQARSGGCTASPPARLPQRGFRHPREVI
ncbi:MULTISPECIES: hypothetical protein [unclassified Bradyrhizobium]